VKRNSQRFPPDFLFQLSLEEAPRLRFHLGTSRSARGGRRYLPYAFTEQSHYNAFHAVAGTAGRAKQLDAEISRLDGLTPEEIQIAEDQS
jgi:hypothetical protein